MTNAQLMIQPVNELARPYWLLYAAISRTQAFAEGKQRSLDSLACQAYGIVAQGFTKASGQAAFPSYTDFM